MKVINEIRKVIESITQEFIQKNETTTEQTIRAYQKGEPLQETTIQRIKKFIACSCFTFHLTLLFGVFKLLCQYFTALILSAIAILWLIILLPPQLITDFIILPIGVHYKVKKHFKKK